MTRESSVVDSTLRALLYRKRKTDQAHQTTVLVLLFHHMKENKRALHELKKLHDQQVRIRICPDEQILKFHSVTELAREIGIDDWLTLQEAEIQKDQFDHIYIPILPFSTVTNVLDFNDQDTATRIMLWALMRGKSVSAYASGADPYHPFWQEAGLDHGTVQMKSEMKKRLQLLKGYGIELLEQEDALFKQILERKEKAVNQVITANTIKQYAKEGKQAIEVSEKAIITPLARDMTEEYTIEIVRKVR